MKRVSYKVTTSYPMDTAIIPSSNNENNVEIVNLELEKFKAFNMLIDHTFESFIKNIKASGYLNNNFDYKDFMGRLNRELLKGRIEGRVDSIYIDLIECNGFLDKPTIQKLLENFDFNKERIDTKYEV